MSKIIVVFPLSNSSTISLKPFLNFQPLYNPSYHGSASKSNSSKSSYGTNISSIYVDSSS